MGIAAGTLDRIVTISESERVQSDSGQFEITWTPILTDYPARRMQKGGGQNYEGEQRVSNNTESFQIRYSGVVVKAGMRLEYNGGVYNIVNVQEVGRNVAYELLCEKKDNQ
jgi:SPP1 family predicted phage head-tail adaptor